MNVIIHIHTTTYIIMHILLTIISVFIATYITLINFLFLSVCKGYLCGKHSMNSAGVSERGYLCGEHSTVPGLAREAICVENALCTVPGSGQVNTNYVKPQ